MAYFRYLRTCIYKIVTYHKLALCLSLLHFLHPSLRREMSITTLLVLPKKTLLLWLIILPSSWVGVECLHVVDATMMMLQQYTVAQGPICDARCGLRMQRMTPVLRLTLSMCV